MSAHKSPTIGQRILSWVAPLAFLAVGCCSVYGGVSLEKAGREPESWPTTQGTILLSHVNSYLDENVTDEYGLPTLFYRPVIRYEYEVAGARHVGKAVNIYPIASSQPSAANEVVARYPAGTTATVYYQPDEPACAVLEPGAPGSWMLILFGAVFAAFGLIALPPLSVPARS